MPPLPFDRSYWASHGLLAGCYPCSTNPDEARRMAAGLVQCRVSHFINLMEPDEMDRGGRPFVSYQPFVVEVAQSQGVTATFSRHPIKDCSVPKSEEMEAILDEIDIQIAAGCTVYVHCWGGRGRTGAVVGCHLIRHRIATPKTVFALLAELTAHNAAIFGTIPETPAQKSFLRCWNPGGNSPYNLECMQQTPDFGRISCTVAEPLPGRSARTG